MPTIYKCSSEECPICATMRHYDASVLQSLGFQLVEVENPEEFPELWDYILRDYPYEDLVFPSYIYLEKKKCVVGGSAKVRFRKMCECFLPEVILDGEPVPFLKERIIAELLVRLKQFGWELLSTSPLLFQTGKPLDPPSMVVTPDGKEVLLFIPDDVFSLDFDLEPPPPVVQQVSMAKAASNDRGLYVPPV